MQKIGFKNNLAFALLYASKLHDAKKEAERLNPQPKAFIVAAEAITQGSKAGLAQAQKITSGEDESKTVTKAAGDIAMRYRAYPQAADLLEAGASGSYSGDVMGLASILRKTKKSEDMTFPDDPAGMVEKMFVEALKGRFTPEVSMRLSSKNALKFMKLQDPEEVKKSLNEIRTALSLFLQQGLPVDAMVDVVLEVMQVTSEGDDANGYKVSASSRRDEFDPIRGERKWAL